MSAAPACLFSVHSMAVAHLTQCMLCLQLLPLCSTRNAIGSFWLAAELHNFIFSSPELLSALQCPVSTLERLCLGSGIVLLVAIDRQMPS